MIALALVFLALAIASGASVAWLAARFSDRALARPLSEVIR